jgi:hypothetical protein
VDVVELQELVILAVLDSQDSQDKVEAEAEVELALAMKPLLDYQDILLKVLFLPPQDSLEQVVVQLVLAVAAVQLDLQVVDLDNLE